MSRTATLVKPSASPSTAPETARAAIVPPTAAGKAKPLAQTSASTPVSPKVVTHEMIAFRAFEISRTTTGGSELENWLRAEREFGFE